MNKCNGMYYCEGGISKEKVDNGTLFPDDIKPWIYKIYSIYVEVEKDENNDAIVTVSDHGTGIAISTLKSMCNVGESYFAKNHSVFFYYCLIVIICFIVA